MQLNNKICPNPTLSFASSISLSYLTNPTQLPSPEGQSPTIHLDDRNVGCKAYATWSLCSCVCASTAVNRETCMDADDSTKRAVSCTCFRLSHLTRLVPQSSWRFHDAAWPRWTGITMVNAVVNAMIEHQSNDSESHGIIRHTSPPT